MRQIDADKLAEGLKLHYQDTNQKCETDRSWAIGYNAGLERALYSIAYAEAIVPPPNTPLTLEELRELVDKCEGVYVAHVDGSPVFRGLKYCAAVLDSSPAFGSTTMHVHAIYGDRLTMWEDDYGKTWMAYRRKPEGRATCSENKTEVETV